jgi:hypothetical protein
MSTNPWSIDKGLAPASILEAKVLRRSLSNGAVLLGSIAVKPFAIKYCWLTTQALSPFRLITKQPWLIHLVSLPSERDPRSEQTSMSTFTLKILVSTVAYSSIDAERLAYSMIKHHNPISQVSRLDAHERPLLVSLSLAHTNKRILNVNCSAFILIYHKFHPYFGPYSPTLFVLKPV